MNKIENLEDHMAFSCQCGCVRFNLLKSGGIECDDCGEKIMDTTWGQAIEQAEKQEPVAWMSSHDVGFKRSEFGDTPTVPLYTTPQPQREWVGLTDEEIGELHHEIKVRLMGTFKIEDIYRAIEVKLKEKNT